MKIITMAAALAAGLALSGCATPLGGDTDATQQLLQNLRHCSRTYMAGVGGLAPPVGQLRVECPPEPYAAAGAAAKPEPATPSP